ncbi:uncharacterized protein LOC112529713 [Cynara cardunculus var. scolymus]|uniref:uncharacterized protein LOC112529713 n=1 Tax=Cynara cardunculus var. scolymus TaxID=59895 RepID=UPI000D62FC7E|nr:uncharacterized protein LOC112529713 [Cynara cardunculus var. scolymus]
MKRKRKRPLRGVEKGAMTSSTNDTVPVVVESSITIDAPTNHSPSVAITFPSRSIGLLSLIFGPVQRSMASLHNLWTNYYPPGAFGEESALMPGSDLNFIIIGLLAFLGIKAQGNTGFPFQTNPRTTMVSVSSLITFAVASSAKHVFSVGRPALTSIYTVVARLGRMVSLVTLVGSLTLLLYL